MTTAERNEMHARIEKHGNNLNAIFNTGIDPVKLCKRLRTLELKAERMTTAECNTNADHSKDLEAIRLKVIDILKATPEQAENIFINGDPRGYTLKIQDKYVSDNSLKIHTDWGGYGILAPDFFPNN